MAKTIALLGALDTKGHEYGFVKQCIEARGHRTLLIDVGVLEPPRIPPDVPRSEVARAAGVDLDELVAQARPRRGRGGHGPRRPDPHPQALRRRPLRRHHGPGRRRRNFGRLLRHADAAAGRAQGDGLHGGRHRRVGLRRRQGHRDGPQHRRCLGHQSRSAARSLPGRPGRSAGWSRPRSRRGEDKPLVVASMFGNSTPCVEAARAILEEAGYEVLVFHATGTGGRTMESLVEAGLIAGVLDITTTEWADELVGGVLTAGPTRLEAAARIGRAGGRHAVVPRHGQLLGPAHGAQAVRGPQVLPAQSQRHPDADHARRMPPPGRDLRREAQPEHRPGDGAPAAAGLEHDRLARRAVLVARGRPGVRRCAEEEPPAGHPGRRDGRQRQRPRVRPALRGDALETTSV